MFQYNKALLFKSGVYLPYDETVFRSNFRSLQRFWIVQYQLIAWLERTAHISLAIECYSGNNYYIKRRINQIKLDSLSDDEARRVFLENLISDVSPMVSLQGLYLWSHYAWSVPIDVVGRNGYSRRILAGVKQEYFSYMMDVTYGLSVPDNFMQLLTDDDSIYMEARSCFRDYVNNKSINPGLSLMCLDLLHNIIFDVIAGNVGVTMGDFGENLMQMNERFPIAYSAFHKVHDMRNQKTFAHYKDKKGHPRTRITNAEYEKLLSDSKLNEAYAEIFEHYSRGEQHET